MLSSLHHFTWSSQLPSFLHFTGGEADTVRTGGPLMVLELGGGTAVLGAPANPPLSSATRRCQAGFTSRRTLTRGPGVPCDTRCPHTWPQRPQAAG